MGACAYILELFLRSGEAISPEAVRPGPEDNYVIVQGVTR